MLPDIFSFSFSTSQWYDENGKVLRRYPTNEELDKSLLNLFTKVSRHCKYSVTLL